MLVGLALNYFTMRLHSFWSAGQIGRPEETQVQVTKIMFRSFIF